MEIVRTDYQVRYDEASSIISCQGSFRLTGEEYRSVLELMVQAADARPPVLTLNLRELQFLNSSGINMLSKLILHVRKHSTGRIVVLGSSRFPWQEKSLINLKRLLPALTLEIA